MRVRRFLVVFSEGINFRGSGFFISGGVRAFIVGLLIIEVIRF